MSDDRTEFIDMENYQGMVENISFKDIVLNHFKRIGDYASVEFVGGYWEDQKLSVGGQITVVKKYVPDTRQTYINAVIHLANLLLPHFDEEMNSDEKVYLDSMKIIVDDSSIPDQEVVIHQLHHARQLFRGLSRFLYRVNYLANDTFQETAL